MLISKEKHFIFVHVYKTGGSSLTRLLAPYVEERFRMKEVRTEGPGWQGTWHYRGRQHAWFESLLEDEFFQSENLFDYRVFAIVRNPYSWALSVWNDFYRREEDAPEWFKDQFPERTNLR